MGVKARLALGCNRPVSFAATKQRINPVFEVKPEVINAKPAVQMQSPVKEVNSLLHVTRSIGHVSIRLGGQLKRVAADRPRQAHVDLVVVKVRSGQKESALSKELIGVQILGVHTLY